MLKFIRSDLFLFQQILFFICIGLYFLLFPKISVAELAKEMTEKNTVMEENVTLLDAVKHEQAIFAGGCFWCMEPPFEKLSGVIAVTSGYAGGSEENPTYKEVSNGKTGHAEVVQVIFDPQQIKYESLLDVFWKNIDPTVKNRQFCDVGPQYRSAIFVQNEHQLAAAEASREAAKERLLIDGAIIHTEIKLVTEFYQAEEYHQDYSKKNPLRYKYYRHACGRDKRLKELWDRN